jgi:uncharacterized protein with von Willebrand factor type A (vWA) domain
MDERYSIEVNDEAVVIYGDISIEEAFDFMNFFEKKGFKSLSTYDSTLYMRKKSIPQIEESVRLAEHANSEKFHELLHDQEKKSHEKTKTRVSELESLVKTIISDKSERIRNLEKVNDKLLKSLQLNKLQTDSGIQELLSGFGISRPMTQEEKDGAFNQLLNMKKNPQDIMPTIEEFMNDHRSENETTK